jgi:hypothetical protein
MEMSLRVKIKMKEIKSRRKIRTKRNQIQMERVNQEVTSFQLRMKMKMAVGF